MQGLDLSKINELVRARSVAEAWNAVRQNLCAFGFEHILYGANRLRGKATFGKRQDSFFLSDLPDSFMEPFWNEELYRSIPVAIWAMQNEGPLSFRYGSKLYHAGLLPPEQHQSQEILMGAGVLSGYVIGFNPPDTTNATALSLINFRKTQEETDEIWQEFEEEILLYAEIFNLRMASLPIPNSNSRLTKRQIEVMTWVAHGKTTADVAQILGLSTATIEKHLRQARQALGVSTTTQAILHAQINNHIYTTGQNSDSDKETTTKFKLSAGRQVKEGEFT